MRIAVNTRFLLSKGLTGFGVYTHEIMRRLVTAQPTDEFAFCFDRKFDPSFIYGDNVRGVCLYPPARHTILFHVWYQLRLKSFVKKWNADILFSPDSFMPLGLNTPSVITVHDVAYKRFPDMISRDQLRYYETFMPKYIDQATHIITVSEFSKREICQFYDVDPTKITVIYNGVSEEFTPMGNSEQQVVRQEYSDGCRYLLYVGAIHPRKNLATMIRSYDHFRERSSENVKLIIAGGQTWQTQDVKSALEASPNRSDIQLLGHVTPEELPRLVASATAMVYISLYEGFGLPVIESLACGIPAIVSSAESTSAVLTEVGGQAVLQVDPNDIESVASGMLRIIEDAELHSELAGRAVDRAKLFNWDNAAARTYEVLKIMANPSEIL